MDFTVASYLMAQKERVEEGKKQNKKFSNDQRDLKHIYEGKRLPGATRLLSGVKAFRDVLKSKKRQKRTPNKTFEIEQIGVGSVGGTWPRACDATVGVQC